MPVVRVWPSTNQGPRIYRKVVGPTSKAEAERVRDKYAKADYYARVTKYKNGWAAWTTHGTGRLDVKFKNGQPVIGKHSSIPYEKS